MRKLQEQLPGLSAFEIIECRNGELSALEAKLKTEGKRIIAMDWLTSGWRCEVVMDRTAQRQAQREEAR